MPTMSDKSIAQRLMIKVGRTALFVNAPRGYAATIGALPKDAQVLKAATRPADVVQVFVKNRAELEAELPKAKTLISEGGSLWLTYPKGASKKYKADIHRDSIHAYAKTIGLAGVALISIDDDWSAMRFKIV